MPARASELPSEPPKRNNRTVETLCDIERALHAALSEMEHLRIALMAKNIEK
jgi:hypothetical protein